MERPEENPRPEPSLLETFRELQEEGYLRWTGRFRRGRPIYRITTIGWIALGAAGPAPVGDELGPETVPDDVQEDEWDGEITRLCTQD
jgi:hypothetical protein